MLYAQQCCRAGRDCTNFKVRQNVSNENLQEVVKQKYGAAAKQVAAGGVATCDGGELSCCDPITKIPVDVIISSCVIKRSGEKDRGLREAFRVLNPGGRLAISDVVVRGEVPADIRKSVELWVGCVAGALEEFEYRDKLFSAGFENIDIEPTRVYKVEEARDFLSSAGLDVDKVAPLIDGKFMSAFVRATKPFPKTACCGPSCCTPTN